MDQNVAFYNNPKNREIIYQVLVLAMIFLAVTFVLDNMFTNIENRGIKTGFAFLEERSGFGIAQTLIEFDEADSHFRVFIVGLLNTLLVSILGIVTASLLGLFIGVGRLSSNWIVSKLCMSYIEIFRNIPVLLQILFWYNVVLAALNPPRQSVEFFGSVFLNNRGLYIPKPILESGFMYIAISFILALVAVCYLAKWAKKRQDATGQTFPLISASLGLIVAATTLTYFLSGSPISLEISELRGFNFVGGYTLIPELLALWFALSIYTATYIAEAVRAGIEAISKGQTEAALSLGLKEGLIIKKVVLPQALRVIIPPVINQYLNLAKNSSLATAIGYPELVTVFSGTSLNQVGQAVEIILMTMAVYLILSIVISFLMNYVNDKLQIQER